MKINCELTEEEQDALTFMMGFATGQALWGQGNTKLAINCVRLMNKFYALSPDFLPYDVDSFDPTEIGFPFKVQKPH